MSADEYRDALIKVLNDIAQALIKLEEAIRDTAKSR